MIFIEDQDQLLKKHQVIDLQEQSSQDQGTKVIWRITSEDVDQRAINFKLPRKFTRVFEFITFILIDSCVNFAK